MAQTQGLLRDSASDGTQLVDVAWEPRRGGLLRLRAADLERAVPSSALSVTAAGGPEQVVRLCWREGERVWELTLSDAESIRSLAGLLSAALSAELARSLAQMVRPRVARRRLPLLVLFGLLGIGAVVGACLVRGGLADSARGRLVSLPAASR